jgi:hypothetical protein
MAKRIQMRKNRFLALQVLYSQVKFVQIYFSTFAIYSHFGTSFILYWTPTHLQYDTIENGGAEENGGDKCQ